MFGGLQVVSVGLAPLLAAKSDGLTQFGFHKLSAGKSEHLAVVAAPAPVTKSRNMYDVFLFFAHPPLVFLCLQNIKIVWEQES